MSDKYRVAAVFELGETVTAELFGRRIAQAMADFGALRVGESVVCGEMRWTVRRADEAERLAAAQSPFGKPNVEFVIEEAEQ
jgi:hypothetical protein